MLVLYAFVFDRLKLSCMPLQLWQFPGLQLHEFLWLIMTDKNIFWKGRWLAWIFVPEPLLITFWCGNYHNLWIHERLNSFFAKYDMSSHFPWKKSFQPVILDQKTTWTNNEMHFASLSMNISLGISNWVFKKLFSCIISVNKQNFCVMNIYLP